MDTDTTLAVVGAVVSNAVLYTAFSKERKRLEASLLLDVLLLRQGLDHTFVEINKVLALVGLTWLSLLVILPGRFQGLLLITQGVLWVHAGYSIFKYLGGKKMPAIQTWLGHIRACRLDAAAVKVYSALFAVLAQMCLFWVIWFQPPSAETVLFLATLLGLAHFYTVEIDYRWILRVRPFAYLPIFLVAVSIVAFITRNAA